MISWIQIMKLIDLIFFITLYILMYTVGFAYWMKKLRDW